MLDGQRHVGEGVEESVERLGGSGGTVVRPRRRAVDERIVGIVGGERRGIHFAEGLLAAREHRRNLITRHFFKASRQLRTTVMGTVTVPSMGTFIRNRCPSADGSYCARNPADTCGPLRKLASKSGWGVPTFAAESPLMETAIRCPSDA